MTIGLFVEWGQVPVLLSDVLLTGGADREDVSAHPHLRKLRDALAKRGFVYAGLARKMADPTPNASYCWAGSLVQATAFHSAIVNFLSGPSRRPNEIETFFSTYPSHDCNNLEVIALIMDGTQARPYFLNTTSFLHECGRRVAIIGSGSQDAYALLNLYSNELKRPFLAWNLAMIVGDLFVREIMELGADRAWGGGIEVRYEMGAGLERLNAVQATLFRSEIDPETRKITTLGEYYSSYTSSGEFVVFHVNGTAYAAAPHYGCKVPRSMSIEGNPRHGVIGFQLGAGTPLTWIRADTDRWPELGWWHIEGNSPKFKYNIEVMHDAYERMKRFQPKRWKKYWRKVGPRASLRQRTAKLLQRITTGR